MSKRLASNLSLIFVACLGIFFMVGALALKGDVFSEQVGPGFLPFWLGLILVILCLLRVIVSLFEHSKEHITIPQLKYVLVTLALFAVFIFSWQQFAFFYLNCGLFIFILLSIYSFSRIKDIKTLLSNAAISVFFTLFVYIVFGLILKVNL